MAYCTIDDVQALNTLRGDYSASTRPTSTQVEEFIDQIYNTVNSVLQARGIAIPITVPASFVGALKLANAQGAAALAEMAMFPEAAGTPGGSPHGQRLWKMYQAFLKWIEKGELPTAVEGTGAGPRSYGSEESTEKGEPKFKKDKEF